MAQSRELDRAHCERLVRAGVVGRVAVNTPNGPHIIPLNYSVVDDAIVFRTTPYSVLGTYARHAPVAFEVDYVDYADDKGWSVVALGTAEAIWDAQEIQHINEVWPPRPWADGQRNMYFRLHWKELSGRRLGDGWTADNELPVHRTSSPL